MTWNIKPTLVQFLREAELIRQEARKEKKKKKKRKGLEGSLRKKNDGCRTRDKNKLKHTPK